MRIIYISDMHGKLDAVKALPEAELCLIGGDFTTLGSDADVRAAVEVIASKYPAFLGVLGNMDAPTATTVLTETSHLLPMKPTTIQGIRLLGLGGANRLPFNTPNEWDESVATALFSGLQEGDLDIAVTHAPPFESGADRIGSGICVGSKAVAEMVMRVKPALLLCGHIHEAAGIFRLGERFALDAFAASIDLHQCRGMAFGGGMALFF